ncbi:MAG: carboxymuconolactone decarboxylase family protein [PS1 clade bacterium]|uniref:Carboxymuconolactone decarboxylase family protein n=1 Tax=PS1 clade bacterium TaxID=2175152 RepID=A0A937L3H1_9PROT|nr:carboxymuconolactone decarboxylase family protein [PS1 clade bacterium]
MGFEPNSLKIMAHRPEILRGFMALSAAVLGPEAKLAPGLRQMIAYIASAAAGCNYCQAHTAHGAHERGVSAEKIENLWSYETDDLFSDAERAALALAQAAGSVPNRANKAHFDALKPHFTEAEICEIVAVISTFGFLNRWNDTMATPLEESPLAFAEAHLLGSEWKPERHK